MTQLWTILDAEGAVVRPVVVTAGADVAPGDAGEEMAAGWSAVPIGTRPDPARDCWNGTEWVVDLDAAKARTWTAAKAARNAAAAGGCESPLGRVDTTDGSRVLITGAVQMAQLAQATGGSYAVDWTMADNGKVTHDGPAMIAMGVAVAEHVAACWTHGQALRDAIAAAGTMSDLDAIDITAGWPGTTPAE